MVVEATARVRTRAAPALAVALTGLLVGGLPIGGCGDSRRPTASRFDRSFVSRCRRDGGAAGYCGCVLADTKALAAEAGITPRPYSVEDARATGADRDCRH